MSFKQKRWDSVEKASIPIATLVDRYLSACRSAGMSPKTIRVNSNSRLLLSLSLFSIQSARTSHKVCPSLYFQRWPHQSVGILWSLFPQVSSLDNVTGLNLVDIALQNDPASLQCVTPGGCAEG